MILWYFLINRLGTLKVWRIALLWLLLALLSLLLAGGLTAAYWRRVGGGRYRGGYGES